MTTLAFEFSSARRSVAIARGTDVLAEAVEQNGARGTNALGLVEKALLEAKVRRDQIEVVAVGLGPGSYTGIRAAIAVAQGWQLARGVRLLGVSSVESLAAQAQAGHLLGRVNLVIDAQRGEFYLAGWEISAGGRLEIEPLRIVPASALVARRAAGEVCAGPETEPPLFPTAAMLARLAVGRRNFASGDELTPIYLRETAFVKTAIKTAVV